MATIGIYADTYGPYGATASGQTKLATPVIGTPVSVTSTSAYFTWGAITGADSYTFNLNGTDYPLGKVTSYTASNLPSATAVQGYVTAKDSTGNKLASDPSATVTATTTAAGSVPTALINGSQTATVGTQRGYQATASSPNGSISKVELVRMADATTLANYTVLDTDTVSPFVLYWTPIANGPAYLRMRATDSTGAVGFSSVLSLTVTNAAPAASTQLSLLNSASRQGYLYPAATAPEYDYTFTILPFPGDVVITPPAGAVKLSTVSGVVSDADISEGSSTYGTDSTAAIQAFLQQGAATATASNPFNVDWDVKVSTSAMLLLDSYTKIYMRPLCGAILRPNSDCALVANRNHRDINSTDTDIGIYGPGIWNHNSFSGDIIPGSDAGFNQHHSDGIDGWCVPIKMFGIKNFTWDGPTIIRQRTFAIHLINSVGAVLKNGVINAGSTGAPINTDGIHVNYDNRNLTIDNWQINSHDDKIAISVNDAMDEQARTSSNYYVRYQRPQNMIENFSVTNIEFTGGIFGLRVLSGANQVRNGIFKGIYGGTGEYWLIMDNFWQQTQFNGMGPGYVSNITFEDIYVRNEPGGVPFNINHSCANINCNATSITFRNINRTLYAQSAFPTLYITGVDTVVDGITWEGYQGHDLDSNNYLTSHIAVESATVSNVFVTDAKTSRLGDPAGNYLVELISGSLTGLQISDTQVDGLANVVKHTGGTLGTVRATNVTHSNAGAGNGSFYSTASPGPQVQAYSCTTQQLTQGTFTS